MVEGELELGKCDQGADDVFKNIALIFKNAAMFPRHYTLNYQSIGNAAHRKRSTMVIILFAINLVSLSRTINHVPAVEANNVVYFKK